MDALMQKASLSRRIKIGIDPSRQSEKPEKEYIRIGWRHNERLNIEASSRGLVQGSRETIWMFLCFTVLREQKAAWRKERTSLVHISDSENITQLLPSRYIYIYNGPSAWRIRSLISIYTAERAALIRASAR